MHKECSDYTSGHVCSPGYGPKQLDLCVHKALKTFWGGARSNLVGRVGMVWDEEVCPASWDLARTSTEL